MFLSEREQKIPYGYGGDIIEYYADTVEKQNEQETKKEPQEGKKQRKNKKPDGTGLFRSLKRLTKPKRKRKRN